ncbi:MAG: GGDEF domain-containing protein, partial [Actinomycetota bacterium]
PLIPIAVMLPQVEGTFEGYLLGYSLVLFGTVFLLISRLRITVGLIIVTWVAAATSFVVQSEQVDELRAGLLVFYLGTASVLALVGRYYRLSAERAAIAARVALEHEQERTLALVAELDRMTREDSLTGLANRRAWDEGLDRACALAERNGCPFAVVLLDLDRFKAVNDRYGHVRGDEVLETVATALRGRVRAADLLARIGGDEFAVLCAATDADEAHHLARDLSSAVAEALQEVQVSASAGVAVWREGDTARTVANRADRAMYRIKDGLADPTRSAT